MKYAKTIDDSFVDMFREMTPPWGPVGYLTCKRTYSRMTPEGITEEWWQTVQRCCNGLLHIGGAFTQEEIRKLYWYVFNLKCNFSGRALWQLGTKTVDRLGGDSLMNCWNIAVNDPIEPFLFAFNELMLGGGVGYNILPENIHEMPKVKHSVNIERVEDWDCDYIVTDNREGWVELLERVLRAFYFTGKNIRYNTSAIRARGKPIRSFGGVASGSEDLVKGIGQISNILQNSVGRKLKAVDCLDILNIIGSIVVAGSVRRSAEIALGDVNDKEFLNAKNWSKFKLPPWRQMSNNSVVVHDIRDLPNEFWEGYQGRGEPYGMVNLPLCRRLGRLADGDNYRPDVDVVGVNPCVTGDTWIQTDKGPKQVTELLGKQFIAIVDGAPYLSTKLGFFSKGIKPVYKVETEEGYKFKTTEDHKIKRIIANRNCDVRLWTPLSELEPGDKISIHDHRGSEWSGLGTSELGWLLGSLLGDGTFTDTYAKLQYWGPTKRYMEEYATYLLHRSVRCRSDCRLTSRQLKKLAHQFGVHRDKVLTSEIERTSSYFQTAFLSGWFDADGGVQGIKETGFHIKLDSVIYSNLEIAQRMLARLGIPSCLYFEIKEAGYRLMPNGHGSSSYYYCRAGHSLIISRDSLQLFNDQIGFIDPEKSMSLKTILNVPRERIHGEKFHTRIKSIKLVGEEEVFDCQIPGPNEFDGNGFNLSNCGEIPLSSYESCNLSELYLPNLNSIEEFRDAAELCYMTTKTISMLPCISPRTNEIVRKNRRLGIGVTGFCAAKDFRENGGIFDAVYNHIEEVDVEYSKLIKSNESIKLTTVKPSGTNSLLPGVPPGVHPDFAPYYKRRITFASNDPLVELAASKGYHIEPKINIDGSLDYNTMIVEFPIKSRPGTIVASDLTAIDQLENQKFLQTHWSDNAVSMTCYYKKEELPEIKNWLEDNYTENVKTCSFLLHSGHGFVQAPYEEITEQQYNEISSKTQLITGFKDDRLHEIVDSLECAGGHCPIK